ncbi:TonB-dependent siderophore receptor [Janthinobacterium psychrotolerans]|uniref:Outer-membrane receptor for ferric coprogen and ferric-rhodotorulic acid n=1 Tax=Janthinobacterium psychrotolerans TaxID=1747903 RepID=A0A1A7C1Q6_9BURK|nr:TonB-dependent siderophore receptor [Janthinobacterium psychrotolerans]OBV39866.1 outer-membrane receptor for ferric coprogen and ferric-rhodotorulic acid [Janthinobacterium psychrotolerans]
MARPPSLDGRCAGTTPFATRPLAAAVRSALLLMALGASGMALAEEAPAADTTMAEIKVLGQQDKASTEHTGSYTTREMATATRMGLSIRETPQSISVVTRQRMDDMGLTSLADVLVQSTGVTVQENDSERTTFAARGFSIGNYQIDGVAVNSGANALFDTAIYDRIEIVRGATGLVSGNGDPSATINMMHKRPGKEFAASAGMTVGSWSKVRLEGDLSTPLNADGSIRGRLVVAGQNRHSYMDFYKERKLVGAVVVEADLTPDTMLTAGIDYQKNTPKGTSWGTTPLFFADGTPANMPRSFNMAAKWSSWEREFQNSYVYLDHRFANDWKIKAAYGRLDSSSNGKLFYGGNGFPNHDGSGLAVWSGGFPYDEKQDNLDLSANGTFALFGRQHDLVMGVNGWKRTGTTNEVQLQDPLPFSSIIPDFRHWNGDVPEPSMLRTGARDVATTKQSGAFVATRINLADNVKVLAGARVSSWKTYSDRYNTSKVFVKRSAAYQTDDVVTPYAGLVWDVSKTTSLYASYTDLFKPQNLKDKSDAFLDPITGSNVEGGVKSELFDGALNASFAVYQAKQDNLGEEDMSVAPTFVLPDGSRPYVTTGKGNTSKGYEVEVSGSPLRGMQLFAGYTHGKTRTAKGVLTNTIQPTNMLRLTTTWRLPGDWQDLTVGGGLGVQNKIWATNVALPDGKRGSVSQGGYTLLNLMARYQISPQLSATMNVNNALDKSYFRRVGFYSGGYYGEPRSVALNLRYQH